MLRHIAHAEENVYLSAEEVSTSSSAVNNSSSAKEQSGGNKAQMRLLTCHEETARKKPSNPIAKEMKKLGLLYVVTTGTMSCVYLENIFVVRVEILRQKPRFEIFTRA